jgi:RNase P subunit RPR2
VSTEPLRAVTCDRCSSLLGYDAGGELRLAVEGGRVLRVLTTIKFVCGCGQWRRWVPGAKNSESPPERVL